jgi:hypothetical protein
VSGRLTDEQVAVLLWGKYREAGNDIEAAAVAVYEAGLAAAGSAPPSIPRRLGPRSGIVVRRVSAPVMAAVALKFGIRRAAIWSSKRDKHSAFARHVTMWLLRHLDPDMPMPYPAIARSVGCSDHTSALSGVRKIERMRAADSKLAADLDELLASLAPARAQEAA